MRLRFQAHSRAGIRDAEQHVAAFSNNGMLFVVKTVQFHVGRLDDQLAPIRHGVARVDHQVHDDLLHLAGVGANGAQIFRRTNGQFDVFANQPRKQASHVRDRVIQIHHLRLQHLQAAESQKLACQAGSAIRRALNLLNFPGVFVRGRQRIAKKFGVSLDHHEKVVEIMGHAACQSAHRFHLLRLPELLLENVPFADVLRNN